MVLQPGTQTSLPGEAQLPSCTSVWEQHSTDCSVWEEEFGESEQQGAAPLTRREIEEDSWAKRTSDKEEKEMNTLHLKVFMQDIDPPDAVVKVDRWLYFKGKTNELRCLSGCDVWEQGEIQDACSIGLKLNNQRISNHILWEQESWREATVSSRGDLGYMRAQIRIVRSSQPPACTILTQRHRRDSGDQGTTLS